MASSRQQRTVSSAPPNQAFPLFLRTPLTLVQSPRLHLLLLRLLLLLFLGLSALALSTSAYFVLYFTWGRVPPFETPLSLVYGTPGKAAHADVLLPTKSHLRPGQAYDLIVQLDCPLTADNLALGNFMVHLDVFSSSSSGPKGGKPTLMQAKSVSTLLIPPPTLSPANVLPLVWSVPTRTLSLPVLENVVLVDGKQEAGRVGVWVGREDGWGGGREVSTTGARLIVRGRLTGLRSLLSNHPLISFGSLTSLTLLSTLLASLLSFYLLSPSSTVLSSPKAALPPPSKGRVSARKREKAWVEEVGRTMVDDDASSGSSDVLSPKEQDAEDRAEEERLAVLRAKEREVLRVREELEKREEEERELVRAREREVEEERQELRERARREKADEEEDGERRSLLGGSGTTPSHRSFGATTVASTSSSSSTPTATP